LIEGEAKKKKGKKSGELFRGQVNPGFRSSFASLGLLGIRWIWASAPILATVFLLNPGTLGPLTPVFPYIPM
jgi:hypothetical protein